MTCFLFGGKKLTSGTDAAIALTDFLDNKGLLDIVSLDIAAALICLVNIQKQKQIECKNALLQDTSGWIAKDQRFLVKQWKMFRESPSLKHTRHKHGHPLEPLCEDESLDKMNSDIELGIKTSSASIGDDSTSCGDLYTFEPMPEEMEELCSFVSRRETLQKISFCLVHDHNQILKILPPENEFDRLILEEGARYCKVALAAYSWMLYIWTNPFTGCCELTADTSVYLQTGSWRKSDIIIGDNICGWKHSAMLKSLRIHDSDILYANFKNDFCVNPYIIIVDQLRSTIIIAIRGTLSMEDMIMDVTISPQSLEDVGRKCGFDGRGEYCHNGILTGACWIYDDLERRVFYHRYSLSGLILLLMHKILDNAIHNEFPDFKLSVIGHSLGAGIAAMLGLMLRQKYPELMCLCFSPPGCVFSQKLAKESKNYVCSYILHNDVVPRLSFASLVNLRNDIIEIIARIKYKVFNAHFMPGNEKEVHSLANKHLYHKDNVPNSKFWSEFESYKERQ
eukprot:CCRYP_020789-RA/>CCRYP_020789-RA protein AED:0.21 eAED:0.20 QI:0/0/0/1/0/0.1/10/0/507